MLVEVIVERSVQGHRGERVGLRCLDAAASFTGRIAGHLQGQPQRRGPEILCAKAGTRVTRQAAMARAFGVKSFYPRLASLIDRQAFPRRNYSVRSLVLPWTLRKKPPRLAGFFVTSCRFTRTGAGDHHIRKTCPNPDHRSGNAGRRTRRRCPRPGRHRRRCRRTVPMPSRP